MRVTNILLFFVILFLYQCKFSSEKPFLYDISKSIVADSAVVSTAHPLATQVGLDILRQGGNAVDASIAVQFALAVCYPGAGNIGGGGFMIYRASNGDVTSLDYREKAPLAAHKDMYLDSLGNPIVEKSLYGHLAAGVPGTVDGMAKAFEKYSQLKDWAALIQPAIELADKGFQLTEREANNLNKKQEYFIKNNLNTTAFHKNNWKVGDLLVQKQLAQTLKTVRDKGRDGFYKGWVADAIISEMKRGGGIISHSDLENYEAQWRVPVSFHYRGHKVISMPPPSSGGVALAQLLQMVEPYDLKAMGFQSAAAVHLMVEAERRVYADRSQYLGDADFYPVPVEKLLDSAYIQGRMIDFNPRLASVSDSITYGQIESEETTHYSIVDRYGNAVSMTTTLNGNYGAYTVVEGAGFILNNEMDDFSVKPGTPNLYGLVGAEANRIEPNKRMLSSMTPTILEKNGELFMVVGTPGGSTIITSVFQTIVNVIDFEMSADKAVQSPRFHHQWKPDELFVESDAIPSNVRSILEAIGHKIKEREPIGRVEAIVRTPQGKWHGAADIRGDDDVKGW